MLKRKKVFWGKDSKILLQSSVTGQRERDKREATLGYLIVKENEHVNSPAKQDGPGAALQNLHSYKTAIDASTLKVLLSAKNKRRKGLWGEEECMEGGYQNAIQNLKGGAEPLYCC